MELHFSEKTEAILNIEERIKKMSLAYKIVFLEKENQPFIKDGSKEYLGVDNMNSYLDQLDSEKEQWYYCNC